MKFLWPDLLWMLLIVPLAILGYRWLLRRRSPGAVRFASMGSTQAGTAGRRWRRRIPPALFLLALVCMLFGLSRPTTEVMLPSQHETIVLAIDVSGSMRAQDVEPSRLEAAQAAARDFIESLPSSTRVGVVAFASTASMVQAPTRSRDAVMQAIDRFELQRGTAVGSGILIALKTLFPDAEFDLRRANPRAGGAARSLDAPAGTGGAADAAPKPVEPGSFGSAAVILLTDGQTTTGPDPIESARLAAERGVRVYTVGIGTREGYTIESDGWSMRVRLDEEVLKQIAQSTRAEYFFAENAAELSRVYDTLTSRLVFEARETEITALLAALAALWLVLGSGLSMWWYNRVF